MCGKRVIVVHEGAGDTERGKCVAVVLLGKPTACVTVAAGLN